MKSSHPAQKMEPVLVSTPGFGVWDRGDRGRYKHWERIDMENKDVQKGWPDSCRWFVTCPFAQHPANAQDKHTNGRDNTAVQVSQLGAATCATTGQQRTCAVFPSSQGAPFAVLQGERYPVCAVHATRRRSCTCSAHRPPCAGPRAVRSCGNNPFPRPHQQDPNRHAGGHPMRDRWLGRVRRRTRSAGWCRTTSTCGCGAICAGAQR